MSNIFSGWKEQNTTLFGHHTILADHILAQSRLFTDEMLAALIDAAPESTCHVNTMDPESHDPRTRREGTIGKLGGRDVLESVRNGRIWILLQNPGEIDPLYEGLLEDIYDELHERVPGLKTFRQKMSLLISSPNVQVYYHADVPGQTLWQVRGKKRVYIYPNSTPFLPQSALEKIILGEAHEISLEYHSWFDEHAQIVDLEPGQMAHWPLNCPHRIVNDDCLNVSFTTEHWTGELRDAYAVNYANGLLRKGLKSGFGQRFDEAPLSQATNGVSRWGKMGLAAAAKYSGLQKQNRKPFHIEFRVDPCAPHCVRDIAPYNLRK